MPRKLTAFLSLGLLLALGSSAKADSLVFDSQSGSTYTYDLTLDYGPSGFTHNNQILYEPDVSSLTITDLLGVTGVSVSQDLGLVISCTDTSSTVMCSLAVPVTLTYSSAPVTGTLTITSPAPSGTVDYSFVDFAPEAPGSNGTVLGPTASVTVSATPEPSSLILLGTGLAACIGARRRLVMAI